MATADEVIVRFEARMDRYERDLKRAQSAFQNSTNSQRKDMRGLETQIRQSSGQIGSSLKGLASAFAAAFSAKRVQELADSYTRFTNILRVNGLEGENLASVQEDLFRTAQTYGVELESLGTLFGRAAQSAGELGASQSELLQFSEGVSAALKIQGSSAVQSSGALLQLSQALASGIVRAEEYNSINEGALPILRAVANNLEGAGGSVAKLRSLVLDGKVTSEAFFQAFLRGSEDLKTQAASSTLTIGNSFTVLTNALSKFIGETDDALSATERISAAIISLSENLDTVVTVATALSLLLVGRFSASMLAAAGSTSVASTALFALQARAVGAATTMEALAFASRAAGVSMLAAFGGPVGLAVAVLAGGILYLATTSETLTQKLERMNAAVDSAESRAQEMETRLRQAGVAVDSIGSASSGAASQVGILGDQMRRAGDEAVALFKKVQGLELIKIGTRLKELRAERDDVTAGADAERNTGMAPSLAGSLTDPLSRLFGADQSKARADARDAVTGAIDRETAALLRQVDLIKAAVAAGVDLQGDPEGTSPPAAPPASTAKPSKAKAATGPTAKQIEDRFVTDLSRLTAEELSARAQLATDATDRADLLHDLLQLEKAERARQIENDVDYSRAQKDAQLAALDRLYGAGSVTDADGNIVVNRDRQRGQFEQQIERDLADRLLSQQIDQLALEAQTLATQADTADTLRQRRALAKRALEIEQDIERKLLEQRIANGEIADADRARAALAERQAADRTAVAQGTQDPLERFAQQSRDPETQIKEAAVRKLEDINSTITDAITETLGIDDPFIKQLFQIFLDNVIFGPLAKMLSEFASGSGGGGVGSLIVSLFARQTGGPVRAGQPYRVGEQGEEMFVPQQAGFIVPNHQLSRPMGSSVFQTFVLDARGGITTPELIEYINRTAKAEGKRARQMASKDSERIAPVAVRRAERYGR